MKIQVYEENKMSANDKTEKVLRELHILLNVYMKYRMSMNLQNKAEPMQKENSVKKVIR